MRRSPDGRLLLGAAATPTGTVLRVYDLDRRTLRDVFTIDRPNAVTPDDGVVWTPDGTALIVNVRGARDNERELWWVPVEMPGEPRALDVGVRNLVDSPIAIAPDGQRIAFVAGDPVPSRTAVLQSEFRRLERFLPPAR